MADPQYDAKFKDMQKYLPFLQKVIEKLKINNDSQEDNPRKAQLQKMEMLQNLLTNKGKKLKMETLLKCEGVLIKLHTKIEKTPFLQCDTDTSNKPTTSNQNKATVNLVPSKKPMDYVDITGPASPPPQQLVEVQPVEIPTERRCSPITVNDNSKHVQNERFSRRENRNYDSHITHHGSNRDEHNHYNRENPVHRCDRSRDDGERNRYREPWTNPASEYNHNTTSSSSGASMSHDRNPDCPGYSMKHNNYAWHHKADSAIPSAKTNSSTNRGSVNNNEVYSPEESWNEVIGKEDSSNVRNVPIIDLLSGSPPRVPEIDHETIFKYKKPDTGTESKTDKKIFDRLGEKVDVYKNFKINVPNELATAKSALMNAKLTPAKTVPISVPVKVPTIPEVLKSPPLSASDISNLLSESMDTGSNHSASISEIGTRRPPKTEQTEAPSLDMVRKKLAMISKSSSSTQFRDSPASPVAAPASVTLAPKPIPNERIALKYNPHPRTERTSYSSSDISCSSTQSNMPKSNDHFNVNAQTSPLINVNVLPSINTQDPRLRKSAGNISIPPNRQQSNYPEPKVSPQVQTSAPHFRQHTNLSPSYPPRNDPRYSRGTSRPPEVSSKQNDPRMRRSGTPQGNFFGSNPFQHSSVHGPPNTNSYKPPHIQTNFNNRNRSTEEGWDSEPKTAAGPSAATNVHSNKASYSKKFAPNKVEKPKHVPPPTHTYSSEENWDSEPETTPVPKKPEQNTQPARAPAAVNEKNFDNTKHSSSSSPVSAKPSWNTQIAKANTSHQNTQFVRAPEAVNKTNTTNPASFKHSWNANTKKNTAHQNPRSARAPEAVNKTSFDNVKNSSPSHPVSFKPSWNTNTKTNTPYQNLPSPEENWDDEPETNFTPVTAKPKTPIQTNSVPNSRNVPLDPPIPTNSRFSALLNDKSERIKYFEAKKQKHAEPRTYAEFRQAKARAAAEEAAKKSAQTSATKSVEAPPKVIEKTNETVTSDVTLDVGSPKVAPESTLDKLYRSSNFSGCTFPKPNISFKIPKKQIATKAVEVTKEPQEQRIGQNKNKAKKSEDISDKLEELKEISKDHKKGQKNKSKAKNSELPKSEAEKKQKNTKELKELVREKPDPSKLKLDQMKQVKIDLNRIDANSTTIKEKSKGNVTEKIQESLPSEVVKDVSLGTEPPSDKSRRSAIEEIIISSADEEAFETHSLLNSTEESTEPELPAKIEKPQKVESLFDIAKELPHFQPRRILQRRCTMFTFDSAPEVEKERKPSARTFEDLEDRTKQNRRKAEEEEKLTIRKNRNLADMFQKTDDNCTVSTQNIISGKRRTRTTVNFNEVQQVNSIFKQKKPESHKDVKDDKLSPKTKPGPKPQAKTAVNTRKSRSPTSHSSAGTRKSSTAATKSAIMAEAELKKKAVEHIDENENQNNSVSSTTSQMTDTGEATATASDSTLREDTGDNEPSSSAKSSNATPTPTDEDSSTHELLEGFVHDILKPNADTEHIFNLLSQILSEDKLKLVKAIIESAAIENAKQKDNDGNDLVNDIDEDQKLTENEKTDEVCDIRLKTPMKEKPKRGRRAGYKKRNELDRLNDDIRDMFISHGVITATGRRMCTLVAAAATATNEKSPADEKPAAIPTISKDSSPTRIRKSKVVISPIKGRFLRRSTRAKIATDISETEEESILDDSEMGTTDTTDVETILSTPTRPMPVLKPNTPMKLSEEELDDKQLRKPVAKKRKFEVKLTKVKPCPKSKKPKNAKIIEPTTTESDSEDNIDLSHLKKQVLDSGPELPKTVENFSVVKNTNPNWHPQSKYAKWCVVCNIKIYHTGMHYKMHHTEHYASRLAPTIMQQFKQGKLSKPLFCVMVKKNPMWFYRCPFCLMHNRSTSKGWLEHFIIHTSEYFFECSKCRKAGNKYTLVANHIKQNCAGASVVANDFTTWSGQHIRAHVCHLCNYLQISRDRLERHFVQQHGFDASKVGVLGYSINLINLEGVETVDSKKAAELESEAINKYSNSALVIDDDDDCPEKTTEERITVKEDQKTVEQEIIKSSKGKLVDLREIKPIHKELESKTKPDLYKCEKEMEIEKLKEDDKNDSNEIKAAEIETELSETQTMSAEEKYCEDVQNDMLAAAAAAAVEAEMQTTETLDIVVAESTPTYIAVKTYVKSKPSGQSPPQESRTSKSQVETPKEVSKSISASNFNVFMPTRDTNELPINDSFFSESLLNIEQEAQSNIVGDKNAVNNTKNSISIAERLSQRFKGLQERASLASTVDLETVKSTYVNTDSQHLTNKLDLSPTAAAKKTTLEDPTTENTSSKISEISSSDIFEDCADIASEHCDKGSNNEDDEDCWEDIEITDSAPSTTSSCSAISKESRNKNKTIFQKFNRMYSTTSSKFKKNPTSIIANKKKLSNPIGKTVSIISKTITEKPPQSMTTTENLTGFRPMITNLEDLLPDSPCNDPIELVPELTPLEPLQDLNDISSILESNFSPLDTQSLMQHLDMETSNSVCINSDNQQTSIQEALDFVSEQQQFDAALDVTAVKQSLANPVTINRIQNVGYSTSSEENAFKFYCISDRCTFLYSSEAIGLETHYLCEHPKTKWTGFCHTCNEQIKGLPKSVEDIYALTEEIKHMLEKHTAPKDSIGEASATQQIGDAPVTEEEERPRIKIRRLTGDCLSTLQTDSNDATPVFESPKVQSAIFTENTKLCDLLNAKPRPPTKQMPPQLQIELTEPLFATYMPLFKNVAGSEFAITSVSSTAAVEAEKVVPPICQMQIASVMSLSDPANVVDGLNAKPQEKSTLQLPKISNVRSLNTVGPKKTETLWTQHIRNESTELEKSSSESQEISQILTNPNNPATNALNSGTARILDSPEPMVVAETLPVGQATAGDFLITQTVSAQYGEGTSDAQLGFNISIATTNPLSKTSSRSNSGSSSPAPVSVSTNAEKTAMTKPMGRPTFKCMGNGCKYQTRVSVAMSAHLLFHEQRNLSTQRDYFLCSFCKHLAKDVDDYIQHAEAHGQNSTEKPVSTTDTSSVNALTQKIQSILNRTDSGSRTTSPVANLVEDKIEKTPAVLPPHIIKLEETIDDMISSTGIADDKLYRCVIEGCKTKLTDSTFNTHIVYHVSILGQQNPQGYMYKCPHCTAAYHRTAGIRAHIKCHGRHRYFCYICMTTASNAAQILRHFSEKHWRVANMKTAPLLKPKVDATVYTPVYYVAYAQSLSDHEVEQFGEKLVVEWQRKKAGNKTHFKPSDIALLPTQPIFKQDIYCAECLYKTKVRTNMLRHLQMHKGNADGGAGGGQQVANVDPVNPVPCLNTNEKHFDKMSNLASSAKSTLLAANSGSTVTKPRFKIPYAYIPPTKRNTCGATGCQYLTVAEDIFRAHLSTLHGNIMSYRCLFCKEEICKRGMSSDRIVNHLRFHGEWLYQCEDCNYLHYMKSVVERHIQERHSVLRVNMIAHHRTEEDMTEGSSTTQLITGKKYKNVTVTKTGTAADDMTPAAATSTSASTNSKTSKHKWMCDLCGHRANTQGHITAHCLAHHNCQFQYQCVHCTFGASQLSKIMSHIDDKHDGSHREARTLFRKLVEQNEPEDAADTRPLWQRDDPKRVRHIRGILMENEEESEQYQKRLCLDDYEDDEDSGSAEVDKAAPVSKPTPPVASNSNHYDFGCYHCDNKCSTYEQMRTHWDTVHDSSEKAARPFLYRLVIEFKCPECLVFLGYHNDLQLHLKNVHNKRFYIAADAKSKELRCGYCNYTCKYPDLLIRHHQREQHKAQDLKRLSTDQIVSILKMGSAQSYFQCPLCADIFPSSVTVDAHVSEQHPGEGSFAHKQLNNSIIYKCAVCPYTSTNELTTMRHMIDHYGEFKRCYFCHSPQVNFNGYMQHCYSDHREYIRKFSELYPLGKITSFLVQMFVIFPNGLIINKRNLRFTQYGSEARIKQLYIEICKTSQEPPIPRLSIARLVARKSIEEKQNSSPNPAEEEPSTSTAAAMQLAGNSNKHSLLGKKISKRRITVSFGHDEINTDTFRRGPSSFPSDNKKRKLTDSLLPPVPISDDAFSSASSDTLSTDDAMSRPELEPFSYYGKVATPIDLSKIYTRIVIAGVDQTVSIKKFKMLCKIDARVVVTKEVDWSHVRKACPASQKHKFVQRPSPVFETI